MTSRQQTHPGPALTLAIIERDVMVGRCQRWPENRSTAAALNLSLRNHTMLAVRATGPGTFQL